LPTGCAERSGGIVLGLLLVGGIDPIELAQQSRPFELGRFIAAAGGAIRGGDDAAAFVATYRMERACAMQLAFQQSGAAFHPIVDEIVIGRFLNSIEAIFRQNSTPCERKRQPHQRRSRAGTSLKGNGRRRVYR
jgi:hypothetical protein